MRTTPLAIAIAMLSAACATPPAPSSWQQDLDARGYVLGEPVGRIRDYRIIGWTELDRSHVVIEAGVRERYLLTLFQPCDGVRTASSLAFTTTAGGLTEFDQILVRGPGSWYETCRVKSIHRLEREPAVAATTSREPRPGTQGRV